MSLLMKLICTAEDGALGSTLTSSDGLIAGKGRVRVVDPLATAGGRRGEGGPAGWGVVAAKLR